MRCLFSSPSLQFLLLMLMAARSSLRGINHDDPKLCPCKEWSQSSSWNSSAADSFHSKFRSIKQVCVQVDGYASTDHPIRSSSAIPGSNVDHIEQVRRLLLELRHGELMRSYFYMNIYWFDDHWDDGSTLVRRHCDVILRVVDDVALNASAVTSMRWSQYLNCPGDCSPVPSVGVPVSVLIAWMSDDDAPRAEKADRSSHHLLVTCSLTLEMLSQAMRCLQFDPQSAESRRTMRLAFLLYSILWRRIVECGEQRRWDREVMANGTGSDRDACAVYGRPLYRLVQRRVFALIVWIGSSVKLDLLRRQALTLRRQPFDSYFGSKDGDFVVAWLATDETYPCREGSTACLHPENYRGHLPKSNTNSMPVGWRCAQRRPLRSLSHSLLLFDPQVVLLLDDDTFLNYDLFRRRHRLDVLGVMQQAPVVFGEFVGTSQQLSRQGVMAGGSGYVIGREAVRRLREKACVHYGTDYEDSVRSNQQIQSLSISREVQELCASESSHCIAIPSSVLPSAVHHPHFAPTSVRLIDICTSLMAEEHMCIHSDHSMGRCLLYGAHAAPVAMACERKYVGPWDPAPLYSFSLNETSRRAVHSSYRSPAGEQFSFVPILSDSMPVGVPAYVRYSGMCFRQRYCDLEESITCHRFQASPDTASDGMAVERLYGGRSFKHKNNYGSASTCEIISNNAPPRSCF